MKRLLSFLLLFSGNLIQAQSLMLVDKESGASIDRVMVFDKSQRQAALSGIDGRVDLSGFGPGDTLVFQHPSYERLELAYSSPSVQSGKISLKRGVIQLSEFVVSATRWEQSRMQVPGRVMAIDRAQVRLLQPQTMADALGSTGEVFIQKSQAGGGSPMIRGFSANALLIVVDGVRMNNAIFRGGNLQNVVLLDANILEHAEVLMGPGAVIYGSDALGGVMDFHTLTPSLSLDDKTRVQGMNTIRYGTASREIMEHFQVQVGKKRWASLTSLTLSNFGDSRSGRQHHPSYPAFGQRAWYVSREGDRDTVMVNTRPEIQLPSGYKQLNLMQKLVFAASSLLDIQYALHLSTSTDIPRYDRLTEGSLDKPRFADWHYGPQKWMMNHLLVTSREKKAGWDQLRISMARQDIVESRHDRRFERDEKYHRQDEVTAYTLNVDAEKKSSNSLRWFYGLEGVRNDVRSAGYQENVKTGDQQAASSRYPDGKNRYTTCGAYLQSSFVSRENWVINVGTRYTYTGLYSTIEDNRFFNLPFTEIRMRNAALTGSLGLVYHPEGRWQFNLGMGSGFRAPNLDDAGKVFDSEPGYLVVPNKDLGPEYAYNLEGGAVFRISERLRVEGLMYHTWVAEIMVRRDFSFGGRDSLMYEGQMSRIQALVNGSRARIRGASLIVYARVTPSFSLSQQLHVTQGWEVPDRIPLRHIPPLFGKTSLSWEGKKMEVSLYADYHGWKRLDDLAPSEQNKPHMYTEDGSPAWWTLNMKSHLTLTNKWFLGMGLENLFDLHYRPYASGISAAGRNIILSLRGSF